MAKKLLYFKRTAIGHGENMKQKRTREQAMKAEQAIRALRTLDQLIALSDDLDRADIELAEEIARLERA